MFHRLAKWWYTRQTRRYLRHRRGEPRHSLFLTLHEEQEILTEVFKEMP